MKVLIILMSLSCSLLSAKEIKIAPSKVDPSTQSKTDFDKAMEQAPQKAKEGAGSSDDFYICVASGLTYKIVDQKGQDKCRELGGSQRKGTSKEANIPTIPN